MKIIKKCLMCKQDFESYKSQNRILCSKDCRQQFMPNLLKQIKKVCKQCGNEFNLNSNNQNYCSINCYKQKTIEYSKKYYETHKKPSTFCKKEPSKCLVCGKVLFNRRSKRCNKHAIEFINQNNSDLSSIRSINCKRQHELGILNSKGKNNPMSGKIIHGKYQNYNNIGMRSGYEVAFAKWCDKLNIKWLYEPKAFDLTNTTYTPDFYLPEFNLYIEIKGWWRDDAKRKFEEFKQRYCGLRIKLLEKPELKSEGVL